MQPGTDQAHPEEAGHSKAPQNNLSVWFKLTVQQRKEVLAAISLAEKGKYSMEEGPFISRELCIECLLIFSRRNFDYWGDSDCWKASWYETEGKKIIRILETQ